MTLTVKHTFISPKGDGPDSTVVKPTGWNAPHDLETTTTQGIVVGREPGTPGVIQELPLHIDSVTGRMEVAGTAGFTPPSGTTAQRPGGARPGEMRFNVDTNALEVFGIGGGGWSVFDASVFAPAGAIIAFAAGAPAGWILCDGQAVNRAANPKLFAYIGTAYGDGDGSLTFNVPNYKGCVLVGVDAGDGGSPPVYVNGFPINVHSRFGTDKNVLTISTDQMPKHKHDLVRTDISTTNVNFPVPFNGGGGTTGSGNALTDGGYMTGSTSEVGASAPITLPTQQYSCGAAICIRGG